MKKLSLLLAICMILTLVFSTVAVAETGVGYGSKKINGSGTITIKATEKPKYVYITIVGCSGVSTGYVDVAGPNSTGATTVLVRFTGDTSVKKTIVNGSAGEYDFHIYTDGSCTVNITMTR